MKFAKESKQFDSIPKSCRNTEREWSNRCSTPPLTDQAIKKLNDWFDSI